MGPVVCGNEDREGGLTAAGKVLYLASCYFGGCFQISAPWRTRVAMSMMDGLEGEIGMYEGVAKIK